MSRDAVTPAPVISPERLGHAELDGGPGPMTHVVQLYESDTFLANTVARFLGAGLGAGEPAVVIAGAARREACAQRLAASGFDVERLSAIGRLVQLDARATLAAIMAGELPDWERFQATIGGTLARLGGAGVHVRAYGELADLLWRDGNSAAALRIEEMWNDLGKRGHLSLLCAYIQADEARSLVEVCQRHSHVLPPEGDIALAAPAPRPSPLGALELRALALASEVDRWRQVEHQLNRLLDDQKQQGAAMEERFRLLVESVSDYAIFILDPGGHITTWNAGAERINGYRAGEIIGRHFSCFYADDDVRAGACARELEEAARVGRVEDEGWRRRQDGSRFWANVVLARMLDGEGKLVGFAQVTRDLTERKRAEEKLALEIARRENAEEAVRLSELYTGCLGHDLRGPLNSLLTGAHHLRRQVTLAAHHQTLQRMIAGGDRMMRMINQLLDFTRIRLGNGLQLGLDVVVLAKLCRAILDDLEAVYPTRTIFYDAAGDTTGWWDGDRLAQVFANLIGNAIEYCPAGEAVSVRIEGRNPRHVIATVHNGGVIDGERLASLFEPFKARGPARGRTSGVGLGLFITRQIVQLHGGTIDVESRAETGTTFLVTLPRRAPAG